MNTGIVGDTLGISAGLEARDRNRDRRAQREYEGLQRANEAYNYGEQRRSMEAMQDMAPAFAGGFRADYITPEMLGATDRNDLGGAAFEQVLNSASGYNPVVASSPYMNALPSQRAQQQYLKDLAGYNTERTLSGYEDRAALRGQQYQDAADRMKQEQEGMFDAYRQRISEGRDDRTEALAQNIVNSWIASNDPGGVRGNKDLEMHRGDRRGGKVLGADSSKKQEMVQRYLETRGGSYADLLNDPTFSQYLSADSNTRDMYGQWEG